MPCYDERNARDHGGEERMHKKINKLTRLLCTQCQHTPNSIHPDVGEWWEGHQKKDRKRQAAAKVAARHKKAQRRERYNDLKKEFG